MCVCVPYMLTDVHCGCVVLSLNRICQIAIFIGARFPCLVMDEREGLLDVAAVSVGGGGSRMDAHHAVVLTFKEEEDEDDFHDAESPQSPNDLDEVVLSAEMAQPLQDQLGWVRGDVGGEMTMFMDHQAVEDTIMSAQRAEQQTKRTVKFKDDGSLVNEFPNERLWPSG